MASNPAELIYGMLANAGLGGKTYNDAYGATMQPRLDRSALALNAAKLSEAQRQQQQEAAFHADLEAWDGKPETLASLARRHPEQVGQLEKLHDLQDNAVKSADTTFWAQVQSGADNNAPDLVRSRLEQRIAAGKTAGIDTSDEQYILEQFTTSDQAGLAAANKVGLGKLRVIDPDGYAKRYGKGEDYTLTPGSQRYDAQNRLVAAVPLSPQWREVKITNRDGSEDTHFVPIGGGGDPASTGGDTSRLINSDAGGGYVPPSVQTLGQFVSYGKSLNAKGAKSSSAGTYQINGSTMREFGPKALGADWNNAPFNADTQERVGEAIFDWAKQQKNPAAALRGRWVSLTADESKRLVAGDWSQARGLIARKESGGGPGASASESGGGYSFKTKPAATADDLPAEAVSSMAAQYLAGDKTVMQNLGRGAQGSKNIVRLRTEIAKQMGAQGLTGPDVAATMAQYAGDVAASRTAGTRMAQVDLAVHEAKRVLPLARAASMSLPRSSFMPFSRAQQAVRSGTNDPRLRKFVAANNALVNVYARAISPVGGGTVSDKEHARELLDTAYDDKSYQAVLNTMAAEMRAALAAPADVRADLRRSITGARPQAAPSGGWGKATVIGH